MGHILNMPQSNALEKGHLGQKFRKFGDPSGAISKIENTIIHLDKSR